MENHLINILLAFVEGLGLIVSPCILPILPIVLSGSLEGNKRRPLGIILGFVLTFAVFTFFSRKLVQLSGIDLNLIRYFAYGLLIVFGIIMLSTTLTDKFGQFTRKLGNVGATSATLNNPQGGLLSGLIFGCLIGLIWTPCAGPILAAVIVQTVIQTTTFNSFLVVLAFGLGAGIPMLLIALFGRTLMTKFRFFKEHTTLIRKVLGVIILGSVAFMIYSENPSFTTTSTQPTASPTSITSTNTMQNNLVNGLATPFPAPSLEGIVAWINSSPLNLSQLKGKVVLIDFWTYSCINCVRTLPYIKDWYKKYESQGLVIIGVHTPEFDFEKNVDNVKAAVSKDGITYPVAIDSNFVTWQNFHNQYWPAHYLIDKQGNVVYEHFGEGDYNVTENNIRYLLGLNKTTETMPATNLNADITPETYLGFSRADRDYSPEPIVKDNISTYRFPGVLPQDAWALQGEWTISGEHIVAAKKEAAVKLRFHAKNVYAVMGNSTNHPIAVKLLLNGKPIIQEQGSDVKASSLMVNNHALYNILTFPDITSGTLELISTDPGLEVYTFTFG